MQGINHKYGEIPDVSIVKSRNIELELESQPAPHGIIRGDGRVVPDTHPVIPRDKGEGHIIRGDGLRQYGYIAACWYEVDRHDTTQPS